MPPKLVNGAEDAPPALRASTRTSTLARLLTAEIESGRYGLGEKIPTEAELRQRYDVSRYTVREALRGLKQQGLIVARAGVGTVVRAKAPRARFVQGVGTLAELIQFAEATRMRVLEQRELIADDALAQRLGVKPGGQWHEATVLRILPNESVPVAAIRIYVRPEYADVLGMITAARQPVFSLIERCHGVRIAEVRQQIVAVNLRAAEARLLKARAGACALEIGRQYADAQDRVVMASLGHYPSDRFSHDTRFRIQSP
jgi:DNA-binding GntR family transcriptional regulator